MIPWQLLDSAQVPGENEDLPTMDRAKAWLKANGQLPERTSSSPGGDLMITARSGSVSLAFIVA